MTLRGKRVSAPSVLPCLFSGIIYLQESGSLLLTHSLPHQYYPETLSTNNWKLISSRTHIHHKDRPTYLSMLHGLDLFIATRDFPFWKSFYWLPTMRTGCRRVSGHRRISWTLFWCQLINLLTYFLTYMIIVSALFTVYGILLDE